MALQIETFSNVTGGATFFKAVGHPLAAEKAAGLLARLGEAGPVAIYDPLGQADAFAELYPVSGLEIAGVYVQALERLGLPCLGHTTQPVTDLAGSDAKAVFVVSYDVARPLAQIRHLMPADAPVLSLDDMRLPEAMLTNPDTYLDPLNFATNFAFFRDEGPAGAAHHTTVGTANYWHRYDAGGVRLWLRLIGAGGETLAEWEEALPDAVCGIHIDSKAVRDRFGLDDFCGQLFIHAIGARGHDVVKYALDVWGDRDELLSCTHDANAWPADRYAGLPAPRADEDVLLWVQNSHPCAIPAGGVGFNIMGDETVAWLDETVPPFGSVAIDTRRLLPDVAAPDQIEVQAGKYFVRPRYEVIKKPEQNGEGRRRIAHMNVERTDLKPDPKIPELSNLLGKGYVLPAPILPVDRFESALLPTPMSTGQMNLPVAAHFYDASGRETHQHRFGCLDRRDSVWLDMKETLRANGGIAESLPGGHGHVELVYDFADGGEADGWLHAIFRYEDPASGHGADTSFGAHIFNSALTYNGEPQNYSGPPPGLSTRLFLRLGAPPLDTMCHLIYTVATAWHETSETVLTLVGGDGAEHAAETIHIPANGSVHLRMSEVFGLDEISAAGPGAYVIVRDKTCRLFGYHGLLGGKGAFSLDHMFGF